MVAGLDTFPTYFADHTDAYVLIGGAACDILFDRAALDFRATNRKRKLSVARQAGLFWISRAASRECSAQ